MSGDSEREQHQPDGLRALAAHHRRQADALGRAGYRDQAARHLLEARLQDLRAAALSNSCGAA